MTTTQPTETTTTIFARSPRFTETLTAQAAAGFTGTFVAPPVTGLVEIVELTTVRRFRSNRTLMPNGETRTERVIATLDVRAAQHLISTLGQATIDALETRLQPERTTIVNV